MSNNNSIRRQNLLLDAYTLFKQPWTKCETTPGSPSVGPSACKEKSLGRVTPPSPFNWVSFSVFSFHPSSPSSPRSVRICWTGRLMFESCLVTRINWRIAVELFFFNFHLHLVNPISATSGWLSEHLCTYPPPPPQLKINPDLLYVDCFGVRGGVGSQPSLTLSLIHDPNQIRYANESK